MFRHLRIRAKLLLGFAVVLVFLTATGFVGWRSLRSTSDDAQSLYDHNVQAGIHLSNIERGIWELRFGIANFMTADAAGRAKILNDQNTWYQQVDDNAKAIQAGLLTTQAEKDAFDQWQTMYNNYVQARPKWFELYSAGKIEEAATWRAENTNKWGSLQVKALGDLIATQQKTGGVTMNSVSSTSDQSTKVFLGLVGLGLFIGIMVAFLIARAITGPLHKLTTVNNQLAAGNIDVTMPNLTSRDEVYDLNESMKGVLAAVQFLTDEVAEAQSKRGAA